MSSISQRAYQQAHVAPATFEAASNELSYLRSNNVQLAQQVRVLTQELDLRQASHQDELYRLQERYNGVTGQLKVVIEKCAVQQQVHDRLLEQYTSQREQLVKYRDDYEVQHNTITQLTSKLSSTQDDNKVQEAEIDCLRNQLVDSHTTISQDQQQIIQITQQKLSAELRLELQSNRTEQDGHGDTSSKGTCAQCVTFQQQLITQQCDADRLTRKLDLAQRGNEWQKKEFERQLRYERSIASCLREMCSEHEATQHGYLQQVVEAKQQAAEKSIQATLLTQHKVHDLTCDHVHSLQTTLEQKDAYIAQLLSTQSSLQSSFSQQSDAANVALAAARDKIAELELQLARALGRVPSGDVTTQMENTEVEGDNVVAQGSSLAIARDAWSSMGGGTGGGTGSGSGGGSGISRGIRDSIQITTEIVKYQQSEDKQDWKRVCADVYHAYQQMHKQLVKVKAQGQQYQQYMLKIADNIEAHTTSISNLQAELGAVSSKRNDLKARLTSSLTALQQQRKERNVYKKQNSLLLQAVRQLMWAHSDAIDQVKQLLEAQKSKQAQHTQPQIALGIDSSSQQTVDDTVNKIIANDSLSQICQQMRDALNNSEHGSVTNTDIITTFQVQRESHMQSIVTNYIVGISSDGDIVQQNVKLLRLARELSYQLDTFSNAQEDIQQTEQAQRVQQLEMEVADLRAVVQYEPQHAKHNVASSPSTTQPDTSKQLVVGSLRNTNDMAVHSPVVAALQQRMSEVQALNEQQSQQAAQRVASALQERDDAVQEQQKIKSEFMINSAKQQMDQELNVQLQKNMDHLNIVIDKQSSEIQLQQQQIIQNNDEKRQLEIQIDMLDNKTAKFEAQVEQLQQQCQELQLENDKQAKEREDLVEQLQQRQARVDAMEQQYDAMRSSSELSQYGIKQLKDKLHATYQQAQAKLKEREEMINQNNKAAEEKRCKQQLSLNQQTAELDKQQTLLVTSQQHVEQQLTLAKQIKQQSEYEVQQLQQQLEQVQESVSQRIQRGINEFKSAQQDAQSIENLSSDRDMWQQLYTQLEAQVEIQKQRRENLTSQVDSISKLMDKQVQLIESKLAKLSGSVERATSKQCQLKRYCDKNAAKYSNILQAQQQAYKTVSQLQAQLVRAQGDVQSAKDKQTSTSNSAIQLQERYEQLQLKFTEVQNQLVYYSIQYEEDRAQFESIRAQNELSLEQNEQQIQKLQAQIKQEKRG